MKDSLWKFEGLSSIETAAIGVIGGYDYREWLNNYIETHSGNDRRVQVVSGTDPLTQNLKKLLYKRIDVVVDTEAAIRYKSREMGILDKISQPAMAWNPPISTLRFHPICQNRQFWLNN